MIKKIISKRRNIYILFLINVCLLSLAISYTYAKFPYSDTTDEDIVGVSLNFDIGITSIEEYEEITVNPEEYKIFNIEIENINDTLLYYGVWYRMNKPSTDDENVTIARLDGTSITTSGSIDTNSNKTVSIIIMNKTKEEIIIDVGVSSSNTNASDIEYIGGKKLITGVTSPYAITMDNSVTGGSILVPLSAKTGEEVTITVTPDTGFSYAGATIKNTAGETILTLDSDTTSFKKPDEAVTIRPKWQHENYIVFDKENPSQFSNFVTGNSEGGASTFMYNTVENHVMISTSTTTNSKRDILLPTTLDLTNYETITATISGEELPDKVAITLGAITDISTWLDKGLAYQTEEIMLENETKAIINCDVSDLTGSHYVGLQLLSNSQIATIYWDSLVLKGRLYE